MTWKDSTGATVNGVSDTNAKDIYSACFSLTNVRLVKLNGKQALSP